MRSSIKRTFFAKQSFTFVKFSPTPHLSFGGPMWGNNAYYEHSVITCHYLPDCNSWLFHDNGLVNMQLASQNPFSLQILAYWVSAPRHTSVFALGFHPIQCQDQKKLGKSQVPWPPPKLREKTKGMRCRHKTPANALEPFHTMAQWATLQPHRFHALWIVRCQSLELICWKGCH